MISGCEEAVRRKKPDHGPSPKICGIAPLHTQEMSQNRHSRILNGYRALPYSAPWVGIMTKNGKMVCGAILISKSESAPNTAQWVLTATHCFNKYDDNE